MNTSVSAKDIGNLLITALKTNQAETVRSILCQEMRDPNKWTMRKVSPSCGLLFTHRVELGSWSRGDNQSLRNWLIDLGYHHVSVEWVSAGKSGGLLTVQFNLG